MKRKKKGQIIIIESAASDILTKIARGLKTSGYETVFISLIGNIELDFLKDSYDKTISLDLRFFKINLKNLPKIFVWGLRRIPKFIKAFIETKKLRPKMIIARTTPNWLYVIAKKYFKNCPVAYYPGDIRSFSYKDVPDALSKGIPKFELESEKWAFKNADGIIHKGSEDELKFLNKKLLGDVEVKCPDIFFFPYCLEELMVPINKNKLSKKDKSIHIVCVGHIPIDKNWWDGVNLVTKQGVYVHMYSKTNNFTKNEEKQRVNTNLSDNFKNKFIVLHESINQKELAKEISRYDYGIYSFSTKKGRDYEMTTGNKIASYLEAGIPIICLSQFKTMAKLLKKYKVAVILDPENLGKLKKILQKNKTERFEKNILKARKELGIRKHIPRMEKFFREVERYWKKKD